MKKNKIDVLNGTGTIKASKTVSVTDEKGKSTDYVADKGVIIATGARSRALPNLPQDGEKIIGYRQAMTLKKQPKKMVVVGSGACSGDNDQLILVVVFGREATSNGCPLATI